MQESGKAYLNGQLVDFSEFRVDPDLIREFITGTKDKAPEPHTTGGETETAPEDTEEDSGAEEEGDRDALIAACTKKH